MKHEELVRMIDKANDCDRYRAAFRLSLIVNVAMFAAFFLAATLALVS